MNRDTRRLLAYGLTITMLFNAATVNQNKKVEPAILPDKVTVGAPAQAKDENLKLNKKKLH